MGGVATSSSWDNDDDAAIVGGGASPESTNIERARAHDAPSAVFGLRRGRLSTSKMDTLGPDGARGEGGGADGGI